MYFSKLPENIKTAIVNLTNDEVFQTRFGTDKVLDEIQSLKVNRSEEFQMLLQMFGQELIINGLPYPPMTMAVWSFLWVSDSPVLKNGTITNVDLDMTFYLLYKGVDNFDVKEVIEKSHGFCKNILHLQVQDAMTVLAEIVAIAFKPLRLFPQTGAKAGELLFDADWLSNIITKVHAVTGYTPEHIMHKLSLTACCYYFAQWCRMQGSQNIYRRTDEEILILQMERSVDLICERLIELKVFPPEECNKWRTVMLTPPTDCK